VKGGKEYNEINNDGFKLPCVATGDNLEWRWQHNGTNISICFQGGRYKVQGDGSLIGETLLPYQSGDYQCFVKDTVTGKETFSRKVQVLVTCKSLHFTFFFKKLTSTFLLAEFFKYATTVTIISFYKGHSFVLKITVFSGGTFLVSIGNNICSCVSAVTLPTILCTLLPIKGQQVATGN